MSDTNHSLTEFLDDLRDLGDIIVGWTRPMSDAERLGAIRQWWIDKGEPLLDVSCGGVGSAGVRPEDLP